MQDKRIGQLIDEHINFRLDPDSNAYEAQVSPEDLYNFARELILECCQVVEGFGIETEVALDDYREYLADEVLMEHFGIERYTQIELDQAKELAEDIHRSITKE